MALTITRRPELGAEYPLFAAAKAVWRDNQGAMQVYTAAMEAAGLTPVHTFERTYSVRVPTQQWLDTVGGLMTPPSMVTSPKSTCENTGPCSAADNAKADARVVWLALEAEVGRRKLTPG